MGSKNDDSPSRIGSWILDEQIGSGGLSDVWSARDHQDGRVAAIKILREPDRSESHVTRFLREGHLLGRLQHPSLPRCLAIDRNPRPHIVLELLEGQTLAQHLREGGPLDATRASLVLTSLLKVLYYLHQHGIVHRDVKPSNIYLARDRRVLLLDLGLAMDPHDPLTSTLGDVMGTYAYMAPEQIAGAEVDHRCDLYSLGITLYEAMSGIRPFRAEDAAGYLEAHRRGEKKPLPEMVPDAPIRLLDTISRLMARDPVVRPESASIARAMLTGTTGTQRSLRPSHLMGRMAALGAIEAVMDEGGIVALFGEVGSGTGRMAGESLRMARERHFETIAIRCSGLASPKDPIDQLIRDLRRFTQTLDSSTAEICRAVEALAGEGPLMILIEDIHFCTEVAEQILVQIIESVPRLTVVTTGTRAPLHLAAYPVELRPLNINEVQMLLTSILGTQSPPARLAAQLRRMSGGQPAVIVLAVKDLVSRGALVCTGLAKDGMVEWKLDRNTKLEPTTGMVRLYGSLIDELPEESLVILQVLAVLGDSVPLGLALTLAKADPSGLGIGPIRISRLILEEDHRGETWISVRRPAVAVLLIARMNEEEKRRIHREMVRELERMKPSGWRDGRLAWHRAHSAADEQTPMALLELANDLYQRGRPEQAMDLFGRIEMLNMPDARTNTLLALSRGEVLDHLGQSEMAISALRAGKRLSQDLDDPELIGRALVLLGRVHHHQGDERRALLLAEEAVELLETQDMSPFLPAALHLSANAYRMAGKPQSSDTAFKRCLHIARLQGNREYIARALGGQGVLLAEEGMLVQAAQHLEQEARWFRISGHRKTLIVCLYRLSVTHRRQGRPDLALEVLDEAAEISRFGALGFHRALVDVGRAAVHLSLGDIGGANQLLDRARDARDAGAPTWIRIKWLEVQALLRLRGGDIQAALAVYQNAESEAGGAGYIVLSSFFLGMTGVITADPDSITDAMAVLGAAGDRTLGAQLLLHGATVGGDSEVMSSALEEIRASGDLFLLLEGLLAASGLPQQEEAFEIASKIGEYVPTHLVTSYLDQPMIRWTGLRSAMRSRQG